MSSVDSKQQKTRFRISGRTVLYYIITHTSHSTVVSNDIKTLTLFWFLFAIAFLWELNFSLHARVWKYVFRLCYTRLRHDFAHKNEETAYARKRNMRIFEPGLSKSQSRENKKHERKVNKVKHKKTVSFMNVIIFFSENLNVVIYY